MLTQQKQILNSITLLANLVADGVDIETPLKNYNCSEHAKQMSMTYKNSTKQITVGQAIDLYELGIAVIINDGKDVTFKTEKRKERIFA